MASICWYKDMVTWNCGGGPSWLKFQRHLLRSTCFWASAAHPNGATCSPLIYAGSTSWMKTGSKPKPLFKLQLSPEHHRMKSSSLSASLGVSGWSLDTISGICHCEWFLVPSPTPPATKDQRLGPETQIAAGWHPGTSSSLTIHVWLGPRCLESLRMTASCSNQEPLLTDFSQFSFYNVGLLSRNSCCPLRE